MSDVRSTQATGNAALHYAAWQLSRKGWNVMPTARNAKGSDLFCANDDESVLFGVQSKGLAKRNPVGLGSDLTKLRSKWWIITIQVKSDKPVCFILTLQEVKDLCNHSPAERNKDGRPRYWLQPNHYDKPEFHEAWDRLDKDASS